MGEFQIKLPPTDARTASESCTGCEQTPLTQPCFNTYRLPSAAASVPQTEPGIGENGTAKAHILGDEG